MRRKDNPLRNRKRRSLSERLGKKKQSSQDEHFVDALHKSKEIKDSEARTGGKRRTQTKLQKEAAESFSDIGEHVRRFLSAEHRQEFAQVAASKTKHFFRRKGLIKRLFVTGAVLFISAILLFAGVFLIWIASMRTPTFDDFTQRKIASSTKIYDRTGETLLFDVHENIQRTIVEFEDISPYIKNAVIAAEDDDFYNHPGIDVKSTLRAITKTVMRKLGLSKARLQGGSTITQQVLKNTLLDSRRRISRKMKEWFLAVKLERVLTKDEILTHYLNESPYGGSLYGVQTASKAFFGKDAFDVTLAEAAYLASIPNAPTLYSPYGNNVERLNERKDWVLGRMHVLGMIDDDEYEEALEEEVEFRPKEEQYAKAIHFVEYVRAYLEETYGQDVVENEGLVVTTTLNWDLQEQAETIVREEALANEEAWNASNMALVAVDPRSGQILSMVGSRGYTDPDVDGKFNVALAHRQPGSSFKPFIYTAAFEMGYTDKTILYDVPTQFAPRCAGTNLSSTGNCYSPRNYDRAYKGPLSIRQALGESRNIPAVKALYLVGIDNAIERAKAMGISSLRDGEFYGLTLVLGGGEVSLLDMTSAYGVMANDGVRHPHTPILSVVDKHGNVLEEYEENSEEVIDPNAARMIASVLSDNEARTPLLGSGSFMNFGGAYDVAAKTGTTNDNKDAWVMGFSPSVAVGVWSGNNDNTPMKKGSSISGRAWRRYMNEALAVLPDSRERFKQPDIDYETLKPIIRGVGGGEGIKIDRISGKLATEFTPPETLEEIVIPNPHSILHWVDRSDPLGPQPVNPADDPQYRNWETGVVSWLNDNQLGGIFDLIAENLEIPTEDDDVHVPENFPEVEIDSLDNGDVFTMSSDIDIEVDIDGEYDPQGLEVYVNDIFVGSVDRRPFDFTLVPNNTDTISGPGSYTIKVVVIDEVYNRGEASVVINVN